MKSWEKLRTHEKNAINFLAITQPDIQPTIDSTTDSMIVSIVQPIYNPILRVHGKFGVSVTFGDHSIKDADNQAIIEPTIDLTIDFNNFSILCSTQDTEIARPFASM